MAARLAYTFMQEVVKQCTHGIDLYTGAKGRENLPQIRAIVNSSEQTEGMARAFGAPVIISAELRDGSLRATVAEDDIPILLYEAGEALRFNELAIRAGVTGIARVMRNLGMLAAPRKKVVLHQSLWLRIPPYGYEPLKAVFYVR